MRGDSLAGSAKKVEAAAALKLTAPDLLTFGIIDEIVPEPVGGAHTDPAAAARLVDQVLVRALAEVSALDSDTRLRSATRSFAIIGHVSGLEFISDEGAGLTEVMRA